MRLSSIFVTTYPQLLIHRNGVPLSGGWVSALPSELVPLLNRSWYSGFGEDPLLHYLRLHDKPWPIVLASGKESIPLQWNQSVKCQSKTEIDLAGGPHQNPRGLSGRWGISRTNRSFQEFCGRFERRTAALFEG